MAKRGKKYQEAAKLVEKTKAYSMMEAVELVKKTSYAGFDETVEIHLKTGLDPRHADQQVRGVAMLPHGLGKKVRILVFTQGKGVEIAQKAGADYVGGDELIKEIEGGWLDFDIAISTPDMMGKVGKLGRILGRRGLMPNPKSGTIAPEADLPRVIAEARKGRAEYRTDRTANIHVPLGKVSFEADALLENLAAIAESVVRSKPSGGKGRYIENATLVTSMGPGVKLDLKSIFPQAR